VYRGGKSGLSDTFASALWSANYLFELMSMGYSGVNLHAAAGMRSVSVGGSFVGKQSEDPNEPHPSRFTRPSRTREPWPQRVDGKLNDKYLLEPVAMG